MAKTCKKCGGTVEQQDQFCMHCGMPLEKEASAWETPVKEEPSWTTADETVRETAVKDDFSDKNQVKVLSMWDYLLMLILLAIPVVNIVVCILWIVGKNGNPNRRNFAKAWLILAVVGAILSAILTFGLIEFFVMDHYVGPDYHIEYSTPQEEFIDDFLSNMNEI